jgi:hypothetical protein
MKKYFIVIFLMLVEVSSVWLWQHATLAEAPLAKELSLAQIKITGDEFVVLRNNTSSNLALNKFWLQYYNDFNLTNSGISNSSVQLPAVTLGSHQEILLASGVAPDCGQVLVAKLSFSLKDTAGLLQVLAVNQTNGLIGYQAEDQASWSSKTTDPVDIKPASSNANQIWFRPSATAAWQAGVLDLNTNCQAATGGGSSTTSSGLQSPTGSPPYVVAGSGAADNLGMPAVDAGLTAPQLSEILPNPAPPQSDSEDEFIELYNSNDKVFDLSGFILQTGITTLHKYTFAEGTVLQPHEFKAFISADTGLTLVNDNGQVKFLDPSGNVLSQSDVYPSAQDGQAWVRADGLWQWTTTPTPNAINTITSPPPPKSSTASSKTKSVKAVKSAKTKASKSPNLFSPSNPNGVTNKLHPLLLAGVGAMALLYAGYEYRHDLANQIYRFRRYRETRRAIG